MDIVLEKNNTDTRKIIPYTVYIELSPVKASFDSQFHVPIYLKFIRGQNHYVAEICGLQMQENSPQAILNTIKKVAPTLENLGRMPTYVFIARHSLRVYPVYTSRNENLGLTVSGGPVVRHIELACVRDRVARYLNKTHILGKSGEYEKLHVRGVHQKSLGLVRPIFYLKKRPLTPLDAEFWTPVFPSDENDALYAYVLDKKYQVNEDSGHEVFRLRSQISQALIANRRLSQDLDLRIDRLLPDYWAKLQTKLESLTSKLSYRDKTLDMYQTDALLVAVERRADEDRYSLYIGHNPEDLRQRAGQDLARRGFINDPAEVKLTGLT